MRGDKGAAPWLDVSRNTTGQSTLRCPAQREITNAASGSGYRARRRRLNTHHPPAHNAPAEAIPSVAGSGTGLARRKPVKLYSSDGSFELLPEDDKLNALLSQPPPRRPRDEMEDASPSRSFH